jgi:hypothetical protein
VLFFLLLVRIAGLTAAASSPPLPRGWTQIDTPGYHGAEGAYFDSASGALVRYYLGPVPNTVGAVFELEPTDPCWPAGADPPATPRCGMRVETREGGPIFVQVRMYGLVFGDGRFWSRVRDRQQLERVKQLLSPEYAVWTRHSSGRPYPRRPSAEALQALPAGASLESVLLVAGPATGASVSEDGSLLVEFFGVGRAWFTASGALVRP